MIHPTADVQTNRIGERSSIWQYSIVLPGAVIGRDCNINCHVFIENDVQIGDHVTIKSGVQLWDGIRLKDKVFIGPNATFANDPHPRSQCPPESFQVTTVKYGASIGANSTILSGLEIGRYAMIGAGSVLTKNVGDYELWYGNPARQVGYVDSDGTILTSDLQTKDGTCTYNWVKNELVKIEK